MTGHQTSGSISLDTSGLARSVVTAFEPVFEQINANIRALAGMLSAAALSESETVATLVGAIPSLGSPGGGLYFSVPDVARQVAGNLAEQGYALVAVSGEAVARQVDLAGVTTELPAEIQKLTHPESEQRAREDEWFAPGRDDR